MVSVACWTLLTLLSLGGVLSEEELSDEKGGCSPERLDRIGTLLFSYTKNESIATPITEEELDLQCSSKREGLRCARNYSQECLTGKPRKALDTFISGFQQQVDIKCDDLQKRKEYLGCSSCIRQNGEKQHQCQCQYVAQIEGTKAQPKQYGIPLACCFYRQYTQCLSQAFRECGSDARSLVIYFWDIASSGIWDLYCDGYTAEGCKELPEVVPIPQDESVSSLASLIEIIQRSEDVKEE